MMKKVVLLMVASDQSTIISKLRNIENDLLQNRRY